MCKAKHMLKNLQILKNSQENYRIFFLISFLIQKTIEQKSTIYIIFHSFQDKNAGPPE